MTPARRVAGAAVALLVVYGVASLALDPHGTLGTDTGAKVATLDHMVETGSWHPELPYWAEELDPEGRLHPAYDVHRIDGRWVHVTTLPMLLLARPLYAAGGYRLALLLPMAGAVGAALAARALGRRMGGERTGWWAFWAVGVASPVAVYALDLWEHAPGAACVLGAVALLAGVVEGEPVRARALWAGLLLGLAATMRTEALVYALASVGGCGAVLLSRRQVREGIEVGIAAVAGFAVPWVANLALESWAGSPSRANRAGGAASRALGGLADRLEEAAITLLAPRPTAFGSAMATGLLLVGLVAGGVLLCRGGRADRARVLLALAVALHLVLLAGGLDFVPGMLVAAPLALVGLVRRPSGVAGYVAGVAVAALPVVWAFQYLGGALPQWGGRYTLPSCLLLVVVGVAALPDLERVTRALLVGLAAVVTVSGVAWTADRGHAVADWFEEVAARPEDVLIARNGFLVREGGAAGADRRWLVAVGEDDLDAAVRLVADAGFRTFATIDEDPTAPPGLGDARLTGTIRAPFLGEDLYVHAYTQP